MSSSNANPSSATRQVADYIVPDVGIDWYAAMPQAKV